MTDTSSDVFARVLADRSMSVGWLLDSAKHYADRNNAYGANCFITLVDEHPVRPLTEKHQAQYDAVRARIGELATDN